MTIQDYLTSQKIAAKVYECGPGDEFYSLIMAAMRYADTDNADKLQAAFPELFEELKQRYRAPGGALTDDEMAWVMMSYDNS